MLDQFLVEAGDLLLEIEDTSGDTELDRLRPMSYSDAAVVILCFSLEDRASFLSVKERVLLLFRYVLL